MKFEDVEVMPRPTVTKTWKYTVRIKGLGIVGEGVSSIVLIGWRLPQARKEKEAL